MFATTTSFRRLSSIFNAIQFRNSSSRWTTTATSTKTPHEHQQAEEPVVKFEQVGAARIATLNRPKALNSLNLPMIHLLYPKYMEWDQDPSTNVIVLRGAGTKAFCAGGDIVQLYYAKSDPITYDFFAQEYKLNYRIATLKTPHVALLNGITMGGGVGLSVHGKYRVATENSVFAMPETAIGFFCDVGGSYFLPRLPDSLGMYLALTGARLKAYDLVSGGISTHFVSSQNLENLEHQLSLVSDSQQVQVVLDRFHEKKESSSIQELLEKTSKHFHHQSVEEIFASLQKENSEWSRQTLSLMSQMSPTSLKVVHRQLLNGKKLSLAECFKMELRMSQAFMRGHDFFEGVRALLVEKDKKTKWKPSQLSSITDADVDQYFEQLPPEKELVLPSH